MKARLPQGMGGGPQNMNAMIRQAQKMQEDMKAKQEELEQLTFKTTSGGGMVEVTISGKKEVDRPQARNRRSGGHRNASGFDCRGCQ